MKKNNRKKARARKKKDFGGAMIVRVPDFKKYGGILPVIIVDAKTEKVLMQAWTREKEFWETFYTYEVVLWSQSRKKRWKKGEEKSGNVLLLHEMLGDCDGDSLLYRVSQKKPEAGVCHTGAPTCFSPIVTSVFEQKGNTKLKVISL